MNKEVTSKYLGLPEELKNICFWVKRKYRINELSFLKGGSDIVIEYSDGTVFGYDWVKYPSSYVYRTLLSKTKLPNSGSENEFEREDKFAMLVHRIFARKYNKANHESTPFKEVWNSTSLDLPWENLAEYTFEKYNSFLEYFKSNLDLINQYLSIWYPFSYLDILHNWEFLEKGDAHYSVVLWDTDTIYVPKLGLSFNQNVRWNSKLRSKWDYGFDNMFVGYVEGTGGENVEFDEKDFLDIIIPLDITKELEIRNSCILTHWSSVLAPYEDYDNPENFVGPNLIDMQQISRKIDFLELPELKEFITKEIITFFTNESIWENTMSKMIDVDFLTEIYLNIRRQKQKSG